MNRRSKYAHDCDSDNFGPRSDSPGGCGERTVVRGGYGLITGRIYDASLGRALNSGFGDLRSFASPDNGLTPALFLKNGVPSPPQAWPRFRRRASRSPYQSAPISSLRTTSSTPIMRISTEPPEIPQTLLLELAYVGNLAHHIGGSAPININEVRPEVRGQLPRPRSPAVSPVSNVVWRPRLGQLHVQ